MLTGSTACSPSPSIVGGMIMMLFGPPAVGKTTVRCTVAASDSRLFHNHMTIEPLLEVFVRGTEPFNVLADEFPIRVLAEAARAGVDLVFTLVWNGTDPDDVAHLRCCVAAAGGDAACMELRAGMTTRLRRNRAEEHLAHKPSKRDLEWSEANVREMEAR